MNKILSFLQRLYKKGKRYNEVTLRFVIRKLSAVVKCSEDAIRDAEKKCHEFVLKQALALKNRRNYLVMNIAQTSKQLIACIMNYKVVIKCRQGIMHFINKVQLLVVFRNFKTTFSTGLVMLTSILLLVILTEWGNMESAFAAGNDAVNVSSETKSYDEDLINESCMVVDEKALQKLQEIGDDNSISGVVLQMGQEEYQFTETAVNQMFLSAVAEDQTIEPTVAPQPQEEQQVVDEQPQQEEQVVGEQLQQQEEQMVAKQQEQQPVVEQPQQQEVQPSVEPVQEEKTCYGIAEDEYNLLCRIIEAEAEGEDIKGKILVANVVLNRVEDEEFPDTISGVILQKRNGRAQFSPVSNGRLWSVSVSEESKEAAKRALLGEDYSSGALYFMARKYSTPDNIKWFDNNLNRLFKHGCHEFFK